MTDTPSTYTVHRRAGGYTALPNSAVTDARLTFRARGLLAYMLSRPPGWRFSAERIAAETPEGRDAVRTALRELAAAGYYRAERIRTSAGSFAMATHVAEDPALLPPVGTPPEAGSQRPVKRRPVKQRPKSLLRATTENNRGEVGSGSRDE